SSRRRPPGCRRGSASPGPRREAAVSQRRPPACCEVAFSYVSEGRRGGKTFLDRETAARMEAAPRWHRRGIGHGAFDRREPLLLEVEARDRAEQADGVGMMRLRGEPRGRAAAA